MVHYYEFPKPEGRPLLRLSTNDLIDMHKSLGENPYGIFLIHDELTHRRTKTAKQLREQCESIMIKLKDSFIWPTTDAPIGYGDFGEINCPTTGMLKYLGYAVGNKGVPQEYRRDILDRAFLSSLPEVFDKSYLLSWGRPNTMNRLKKIANVIATSAKKQQKN
ncbi:hypothetical protein CCP1ISM_660002 [Azospirillaceae bacterium]